jgi:hypothetical protein
MESIILAFLLLQTGSSHWQAREVATVQLRAFLPASAPVIKWGTHHKDKEIATRCTVLWREYVKSSARSKAENTWPRWYKQRPWIDGLPRSFPCRSATIAGWLAEARKTVKMDVSPTYGDYRHATLLFMERLYQLEVSKAEIEDLLDVMAWQEWKWMTDHRDAYQKLPWEKLHLPGW